MASRTAAPQSTHKQGNQGVNLKGKGNEISPQNIDFPNVANRVQSQNPVGCGPSPPLSNPDVLARSLRCVYFLLIHMKNVRVISACWHSNIP